MLEAFLGTWAWRLLAAVALILGLFLTLHRYWSLAHDLSTRRKTAKMERKLKASVKARYYSFRKAYEDLGHSNELDNANPRSTLLALKFGKPLLVHRGMLEITEDIAVRRQKISAELTADKKLLYDEQMGFLDPDEPIEWRASPLLLPYRQHSFSTFLAALQAGVKLSPITAGALICCSETRSVVYMRRSKDVHTFPSHFHHFGGGFKAKTRFEPGDFNDLLLTAQREIYEETRIRVDPRHFQTASLLIEGGTGYFQYLFLGVDVSKEERRQMEPSGEGTLVDFKFDELGERLSSEPFVPTCVLQTLIWLSLGAPTSSNRSFSAKIARHQYSALMKHFGMA